MAAVTVSAQTGEDALPLLGAVSAAVRAAGSVQAEGTGVLDAKWQRGTTHRETHFEVITQGPLLMRYDETSGPNGTLQVCDGTSRWTLMEVPNSYVRSTGTEELCNPPAARWADLTSHLVRARITGRDHSEVNGHSLECQLIEAEYDGAGMLMPQMPVTGRLARTFCIDPAHDLILRERMEGARGTGASGATYTLTITYSRVTYGPSHAAEVFQFHPPAGSRQTGFSAPLSGEGGAGSGIATGPAGGRPFSAPVLVSKAEPQYTPEALAAKLEGTVLLSLVVDEKGVPQSIHVLRGLGIGLDEKAIEAVSQWRFQPGMRYNGPFSVATTVEVQFRIP